MRTAASNLILLIGAGCSVCLGCATQPEPSTEPRERIAYLAQTQGYWQVWTIDPDGKDPRQVTTTPYDKASVSWYPSGKHVLVSSVDGALVEVEVTTGSERLVDLALVVAGDARVSPDGSEIAFSANPGDLPDAQEIYVCAMDGGSPMRLTRMANLQQQPAWSPDGKSLYFVSGPGGQDHDIWRLSVATGSREQLTVDGRYHFELDVGSSGELAYSSNRSGDYEVWLWESPKRAPVQLTHEPGLDGGPSWSPRGDALVFHSTRNGVLNLWLLDRQGGAQTQLTSHAEGARSPDWWAPK